LQGVLHLLKPERVTARACPSIFSCVRWPWTSRRSAAGVILSGMGSDGTMGARALKEKAGAVLVQSPGTARFDAMPRSAIDAGLADMVAPAGELPQKNPGLLCPPHDVRGPCGRGRRRGHRGAAENLRTALEKVLILVRAQTGHDFSLYKKGTVYRRIQRRMAIHQMRHGRCLCPPPAAKTRLRPNCSTRSC
jgi:two-component system CheB/CheR fusion protein